MQEIFGALLEQVENIAFVTDERGIIVYGNRSFIEIFAPERRDKVIGSACISNFLGEESASLPCLPEGDGDPEAGEMVRAMTDWRGEVRMLRTRQRAITTSSGQRFLLRTATDVTELLAREAELVAAHDRLRQWANVASHDLRAPIDSYVIALSRVQRDPETRLGPSSKEYIDLITDSATTLVHQLTAMLQRELDAEGEDSAACCDLNLCLAELRAHLGPRMAHSRTVLQAARLPTIRGDAKAFQRLFVTLVEDSIRRRARHDPRIAICYAEIDGHHRFTFEDNGRELSAEAEETLTRPVEEGHPLPFGAGVALAQCQRSVARHGGTIEVDRRFAGGCRIVVEIPIDRAETASVRAASRVA